MASYSNNQQGLINRLKRIEGQVRGIQKMVVDDKYCVDILTQIAAVQGALNKVGLSVLESHTRGCVKRALASGDNEEEVVDELVDVINKFTK